MKFECHMTFEKEQRDVVKAAGDYRRWKFSEIDGDPVLGQKIFCYLSSSSDDLLELIDDMNSTAEWLRTQRFVQPLRMKIEAILMDVRI